MKQTLNKDQFRFQMNQIRPDNFSYEGLGALFDYFEEIEDSTQTDMEFDPIAICCDFSQCSLDEFIDAFPDLNAEKINSNTYKKTAIEGYINRLGFWFAFVEDGKEIIYENF